MARKKSPPRRKSPARKTPRAAPRKAAKAVRSTRRGSARKAAKAKRPAAPAFPFGAVSHTEIASYDTGATRTFLQDVFGWEFEDMDGPLPYAVGLAGGYPGGGLRPLLPEDAGPSCTPYLTVKNLHATLGAVELHGGKVLVPPQPVERRGWFFMFQAPGGPVLGCWQDDRRAPAARAASPP